LLLCNINIKLGVVEHFSHTSIEAQSLCSLCYTCACRPVPFGVSRIWFHDQQHLAMGDSLNSHTSWIWNFDRAAHCSATTSPCIHKCNNFDDTSWVMRSEDFVNYIMKHIYLVQQFELSCGLYKWNPTLLFSKLVGNVLYLLKQSTISTDV